MNKCLRIIISASYSGDLLRNFIQKNARQLGLEGTAQLINSEQKKIRISICGHGEKLDQFVDLLHKGTKGFDLKDIEIEPFLKDKDYRSVFRIIE